MAVLLKKNENLNKKSIFSHKFRWLIRQSYIDKIALNVLLIQQKNQTRSGCTQGNIRHLSASTAKNQVIEKIQVICEVIYDKSC